MLISNTGNPRLWLPRTIIISSKQGILMLNISSIVDYKSNPNKECVHKFYHLWLAASCCLHNIKNIFQSSWESNLMGWSDQCLSNRFLKLLILGAATTVMGKLFQDETTLLRKENLRISRLNLSWKSLKSWPLEVLEARFSFIETSQS